MLATADTEVLTCTHLLLSVNAHVGRQGRIQGYPLGISLCNVTAAVLACKSACVILSLPLVRTSVDCITQHAQLWGVSPNQSLHHCLCSTPCMQAAQCCSYLHQQSNPPVQSQCRISTSNAHLHCTQPFCCFMHHFAALHARLCKQLPHGHDVGPQHAQQHADARKGRGNSQGRLECCTRPMCGLPATTSIYLHDFAYHCRLMSNDRAFMA